jgi:lysophospholipid acyltransferase (LPLAT)-like uncharacterized protein
VALSSPLIEKMRQTFFVWLVYILVQMLRVTYRLQIVGLENRKKAEAHHIHGCFALALWHEYLFASIIAHAAQKFAPLASLSKDGELVARVMDMLGFQTVRGSSSKGGPEAREQLVKILEQGFFTALTVDGPRGPRRQVKGGIVDIARRSAVAVLPMLAVAEREWVLSRSWDQFKIPKPFTRIVVVYGEPIFVDAATQGLAFGEVKARIRESLIEVEQLGRQTIEQGHS